MTLTGVVGRIEWSYAVAAVLEGYAVTQTPAQGWRLAGRVVSANAFNLAQRPLRFVAPHARGVWEWPIETLALEEGRRVTARLGAPVGWMHADPVCTT